MFVISVLHREQRFKIDWLRFCTQLLCTRQIILKMLHSLVKPYTRYVFKCDSLLSVLSVVCYGLGCVYVLSGLSGTLSQRPILSLCTTVVQGFQAFL